MLIDSCKALPAFHPVFSIPSDSANHTEGFAKAARSVEAHEATMLIMKGLALTAFRVLDDDEFWHRVYLFVIGRLAIVPQPALSVTIHDGCV